LERQRAEIADRVAALAAAWSLLRDGCEEFRRSDQARLLQRISGHVQRLSANRMGPLESAGGLEEATIRVGGRALVLHAPPLSHGEHHAAQLAIRLGAADFLAGAGIHPPLIIDDPFVHLDDEHASAIWTLLREIARQRQVIVATQDRLLLEHLGVEPDIVLERPEPAAAEVEVLAHPAAQKSV
jgi:DNA repair exonuclease SbcCD ATPase subunit